MVMTMSLIIKYLQENREFRMVMIITMMMMVMMMRRSRRMRGDDDEDEDGDNVGGTRRHQPRRSTLGGDEPHLPRVPAPRATHKIPGHVPRDDGDNDHCP